MNQQTPLHLAAAGGHVEVVRIFLQVSGLTVHGFDRSGRTPLTLATEYGHAAVVQETVRLDPILANAADSTGWTPLCLASKAGNVEVVRVLVRHVTGYRDTEGASSNRTPITSQLTPNPLTRAVLDDGVSRHTPLTLAAEGGHTEVVRVLIKLGDINGTAGGSRRTALSFAAEHGHVEIVRLLCHDPSLDVNAVDLSRKSPLGYAAANGHGEVMQLLFKRPDIELQLRPIHDGTPLYLALAGEQRVAIQLIFEKLRKCGLCPYPLDDSRTSPSSPAAEHRNLAMAGLLLFAAQYGSVAIASLLLDKYHVFPDSASQHGWTPLSFAAHCGHEDIVKLLVESGAQLNWRNQRGRTPLALAVLAKHEKIAHVLCRQQGIDLDCRDNKGRPLMVLAITHGTSGMIKTLAKWGVPLDAPDFGTGQSALIYAAEAGNKIAVSTLLEHGANLNVTDELRQRTALTWAASQGNTEIVRLLLDYVRKLQMKVKQTRQLTEVDIDKLQLYGAALDSQDVDGWTALMWAVWHGHKEVIALLTLNSAAIDVKDHEGRTALDLASEKKEEDVIKLLSSSSRQQI